MKGVYKIFCTESPRVYIGSSLDVKVRVRTHFSDLQKGKHYNDRMQNTWNKYGGDTFQFEVIEQCPDDTSREELFALEQKYIDLFDTYRTGLNMSSLARTHVRDWTEEERKERAEMYTGEGNPFYGKKHKSDFAIKKRNNSPDYTGANNPFAGKKHSEKTKKRIAETKKAQQADPDYKHPTKGMACSSEKLKAIRENMSTSIKCVIDGIEYLSASEASKALGLNISTICRRIKSDKHPNYLRKSND